MKKFIIIFLLIIILFLSFGCYTKVVSTSNYVVIPDFYTLYNQDIGLYDMDYTSENFNDTLKIKYRKDKLKLKYKGLRTTSLKINGPYNIDYNEIVIPYNYYDIHFIYNETN